MERGSFGLTNSQSLFSSLAPNTAPTPGYFLKIDSNGRFGYAPSSSFFDQDLNTFNSVQFVNINLTGEYRINTQPVIKLVGTTNLFSMENTGNYVTGTNNIGIGRGALSEILGGSNNVCVGQNAGQGYTGNESNNICIGNNSSGTPSESNVVRIGDGTITNNYLSGNIRLGGAIKLSSTQLDGKNNFPTLSDQLAVAGTYNYSYQAQTQLVESPTTITTGSQITLNLIDVAQGNVNAGNFTQTITNDFLRGITSPSGAKLYKITISTTARYDSVQYMNFYLYVGGTFVASKTIGINTVGVALDISYIGTLNSSLIELKCDSPVSGFINLRSCQICVNLIPAIDR